MQKNRSTSNIASMSTPTSGASQPPPRRGASFDVGGSATSDDSTQLSSTPALGPSGLHRIRSTASFRIPSLSRAASAVDTRQAMTIPIPEVDAASIRATAGPMTAGILNLQNSFGEDLKRFPVESLHSFSFSNLTDEMIHTRHNIIKRSVDFLKDRPGWNAHNFAAAQAQAALSGDQELRTMMGLLARARMTGSGSTQDGGNTFGPGPLTGPAVMASENVFEKEFIERSESPTSLEKAASFEIGSGTGASTPTQEHFGLGAVMRGDPKEAPLRIDTAVVDDDEVVDESRLVTGRAKLRRTYTDVGPLELQNRITEVMSQPYASGDPTLLSPIAASPRLGSSSLFGPAFSEKASALPGRAPPTSQAIFMTEVAEPWTISAANDLACLIFGVTKAELRKIGILDLVQVDKRKWLQQRLRVQTLSRPVTREQSPRPSFTSNGVSSMGSGITARLLSKPSSRETGQGRRNRPGSSRGSSFDSSPVSASPKPQDAPTARGVLVCGDVLPILKRNGAVGSASFWVQEKKSALIWVMEEIAEDVAFLDVDEIGCVEKGYGSLEGVWGMERVKPGVDVARLIPGIPRRTDTNTGALDFDRIQEWRSFTARTANDISIPITVEKATNDTTLRVSSFPNIAGMIVLSTSTLKVTSSNKVVSETLFGRSPNGLPMSEIIPGFGSMLEVLKEQDGVELEEGIVIPEHSFRRARAMVALREGRTDAAAIFLKPSGLPAVHRDGAEIMVDVQMRVVKSEAFDDGSAIVEDDVSPARSGSELVYALWVTYSRTLHAVNHGVGPVSPLLSRPGTPPHQPSPGALLPSLSSDESDTDLDPPSETLAPAPGAQNSKSAPPADAMKQATPSSAPSATAAADPAGTTGPHKKTIQEFQILEDMGAGAYGQVKLARNRKSGEKVVIKYVTKRRILVDTWTRDRRLGTVPLEIHVLDYLRRDGYKHPNIVEMSDFFEDDVNYYIEMVPHGLPGMDLFDYIELRVNMTEDEGRKIFTQVASAIDFLHNKAKVVHRDIKDENVVLDGEGRVKLIDFGSASYIKNGPFDVFVGTIDYASPEVLAGRSYAGPEQDIWALGILLYTILYKENPFYSIDEIMDHDLRVPYLVSEESIELVKLMLEREVDKRVDIRTVVGHRWMVS